MSGYSWSVRRWDSYLTPRTMSTIRSSGILEREITDVGNNYRSKRGVSSVIVALFGDAAGQLN